MSHISQCALCKHMHETRGVAATCDAFPSGIPAKLLFSEILHDHPYYVGDKDENGDRGFHFEAADPEGQAIFDAMKKGKPQKVPARRR